MKYTQKELRRFIIQDLIRDIRCAESDNRPELATEFRGQLAILWPQRHTAKLDCYGWPSESLDKN